MTPGGRVDVFVEWPTGPVVVPRIVVIGVAEFDEIDVQPCLGVAYAHREALARAEAAGTPSPPATGVLSEHQALALRALPARWHTLRESLGQAFEPSDRASLTWSLVEVTNRVSDGDAVLGVTGMIEGATEVAVSAWVAGAAVLWAGRAADTPSVPGQPSDATPPAAVPSTITAQQALDLARERHWDALASRMEPGAAWVPILQQLVSWVAQSDDGEAEVPALANLARKVRAMGANYFRPGLLMGADGPLLALVEAGLVRLEPQLLHTLEWPSHIARLVALGLRVDAPQGDDPRHTPLVTHRDNPQVFRRLLELGADTTVLEDGNGGVRFDLGPPQRAALRRARPDLHIPDPPEALLGRDADD